MVKLIINADDFGFDVSRNDAILECFAKKEITTTTIMVNMPGFEDAVIRAHELELENRVGLHLNFTQGNPLTDEIKQFPNFCNGDGMFNAKFHRSKIGRLFLSAKEKAAVYAEAKAQMLRYKDAGLTMMHLDSHHHSHTDPAMCKIVCPLAKELGFKSIRLSRNFMVKGAAKQVYKWYVNKLIRRNSCRTADLFTNFDDLKKGWDALLNTSMQVEVMTHPNYNSKSTELYDYRALWKPISEFLNEHCNEIKKITFLEL